MASRHAIPATTRAHIRTSLRLQYRRRKGARRKVEDARLRSESTRRGSEVVTRLPPRLMGRGRSPVTTQAAASFLPMTKPNGKSLNHLYSINLVLVIPVSTCPSRFGARD